jgi:hypothetical protein
MSDVVEILKLVGPVGGTAIITAWLCLRSTRKNGNGVVCPIPEHVAELATHSEAIATLKKGQEAIFQKLSSLPADIATATAAATGVAIATAMHRR